MGGEGDGLGSQEGELFLGDLVEKDARSTAARLELIICW